MRWVLGVLLLLSLLAAAGWGLSWLREASSVGAGYAAKVGCSLVHVSGLDPADVRTYVDSEVSPLGPALALDFGPEGATARVLGGVIRREARLRDGLGCTLVPARGPREIVGPDAVVLPTTVGDPSRAWPDGEAAPPAPSPGVAAAIARAFAEPHAPQGRRHTKAVVVVRDGALVAERYAPGVDPRTRLLSWSMAKSVLAAMLGVAVREGRIDLDAPAPVPEWQGPDDPRSAITLDQLLRQSSGLAFDETVGAVNDLSRMLFLHGDTGGFAARKPLVAPPDTVWSYSSGTSNILARVLRDRFDGDVARLQRWAQATLFAPAGIGSALLEVDAAGSFVGSSYAYMTARDWARFGELHREGSALARRGILPEGWIRYVSTPTPAAPEGRYGAHWWLNAGSPGDPADRPWPRIPPDVHAARGHSGQWVAVVPSAGLVVVRLGLTVPDAEEIDGAEELIADLVEAFAAEEEPDRGAPAGGRSGDRIPPPG